MQYITENFASINALMQTLNTRKPNSAFEGRDLASEKDDYRFTKTKSYSEAVELLKNGYDEPLDKIKKGVETNARGLIHQKTAVKNDVVGYAPCVPNAIMGIPQSMINKQMAVKKSKIITIIHDADAAACVDGETFIKAGITTLTVVNSLEAQGYRVALKLVFVNSSNSAQKLFGTVTLKDWRQPLDIKKLTFPFCHPSMLRRIGFRHTETCPKLTDTGFRFGYGTADPTHYSYDEMLRILRDNKLIADNEFYINIKLCEKNGFNPQAVAKACGLEKTRKTPEKKPAKDEPLKVGDKVKILDGRKIKSPISFTRVMTKYIGSITTVERIYSDGGVTLANNTWFWDKKWLEKV